MIRSGGGILGEFFAYARFFYALKEKTCQSDLAEVFSIWPDGMGLEKSELYAKAGFQEKIKIAYKAFFHSIIK